MSLYDYIQQWRDWFPVPQAQGRIHPMRWLLLEGNRGAVTAALVSGVFISIVAIGSVWTFEMANLLTETPAVQTILNTFLSGIILLVSIVVSINSIVLSHDITSIATQEERIDGVMEFRRDIGQLTEDGQSPTDPGSFLKLMSNVIGERAERLAESVDGADEEFAENIQEYADNITDTVSSINDNLDGDLNGAEFGVLWMGIELDHGPYMDKSRTLQTSFGETMTDDSEERFNDLVEAFQLFATGKEYFKTLYYTQEVSSLSRTLLIFSLPAIVITATAILAINARLLPEFWILGLPPLLTSVAVVFTVALSPYLILTSYMLRLATVAKRTTAAGPFSLE